MKARRKRKAAAVGRLVEVVYVRPGKAGRAPQPPRRLAVPELPGARR